jgi:hypothetical protein
MALVFVKLICDLVRFIFARDEFSMFINQDYKMVLPPFSCSIRFNNSNKPFTAFVNSVMRMQRLCTTRRWNLKEHSLWILTWSRPWP